MEKNELKIGSYVYFPNYLEPHQVKEIYYSDHYNELCVYDGHLVEPISKIKPIPITEEWLLKFGFEKSGIFNQLYRLNDVTLYCSEKEIFMYTGVNDLNIKYIHQLQNLYFALTGNELKIK
jgi:hypothetical protein